MLLLPPGFSNVLLLTLCQILSFSAISMLMLVAPLIGSQFATETTLATLPVACLIIGTAIGTVPTAMAMKYCGRKTIVIGATSLTAIAVLLITYSLHQQSFIFFAVATGLVGFSFAAAHQFRFIAMESVASQHATTATSIILLGSVFAAYLGPELAIAGKDLTDVEYQGGFFICILLLASSAILLFFLKTQPLQQSTHSGQVRSLISIIKTQPLWIAVSSASIGYALMSFIMTATPISIHHIHGHSLHDAKWVIQSHIIAMFLPSLITPIIARWIGLSGLIMLGLALYAACIAIGFYLTSVTGFWWSLVLLGIGWNFLFIAGTSYLPKAHTEAEKFKVQAFNDGFIFTVQACASLSAGIILHQLGWQTLLLVCLPFLIIPLGILIWGFIDKIKFKKQQKNLATH